MPGFEHKAFTQSKVEIHEPELAAMVMRGDYLGRRARLLRRWRWALAAALLLFVLLVWRGFAIAMRCRDRFGSMLAVGLTTQVGVQTILNIAVVSNTIPNTGISLPFFSYGGTALCMLLAQMGVVLSVSRYSTVEKE